MENGILLNRTYRILRPIGKGGLGVIYLGYHENLQKYVVIKKVKEHCSSLVNNRIEVDILKSLHHTYLPQVYDFIEMEDGIFTVMDYISGHDLKYYLDAGYAFKEEQIVEWMKQLCEVLEYLHSRKRPIIHCDIKPGNIMITEEGNICLIDFNISLDGENNKELVGLSSSYASPEQIKKADYIRRYGSGDKVKMDERTDVYSLAAVFYYVISGVCPGTRDGYVIPLRELEHSYSESLANIVDKAMQSDPNKRFRSAARMLDALEHLEKWQSQYLKFWKAGILLDTVAGSLGLILICFMILGYRGMKKEQFFDAYNSYMEQVEDWMDNQERMMAEENDDLIAVQLVSDGISLLNQEQYKKEFEKYPKEKSDILYGIGQASLNLEDYEQAKEYLQKALDYEEENPDIYRDMAIAMANVGRISKSEKLLKQALQYGLKQDEANLLYIEIAVAKEDYQTAWDYAISIANSENTEIVQKLATYILKIEAYLGNTQECIQFFSKQAEKSNGVMKCIWLRKQAELSIQAYQEGEKQYLAQAIECYESIRVQGYTQLADLYNMVTCYSEQGQFKKANQLLRQMYENYPEEYKVPMRLAYISYLMQNNEKSELRDYRYVKKYYEEAISICENQGIDWKEDLNMVQLETIINQLKELGFL